ncbi:uncharacterized protein LOC127841517 isoform X2 [Dreissena polymorpha]|uniref:Uncharacterized protein n=1 Tax=Dreissena polymorpha TaxID=45954 RepID=A0A9D4EWE8_DREPO|nr:uncharacterized protein LOC127841517 isoform X2 [Dreissena polymorpha]KAH3786944.1 hypothetical protein DPMN_165062 [Dreissena polymorpha]
MTVCIYVKSDNILSQDIGKRFLDYIKTVDTWAKTSRIELAFDDSKYKSLIFSSFISELDKLVTLTVERKLSKVFEVVERLLASGIEVVEMSDHVDNSSKVLPGQTKEFAGERMKDTNSLVHQAPGEQMITRDEKKNRKTSLATGFESNIVLVEGIKPNTTRHQLRQDLQDIFHKHSPHLIFCDQKAVAHLVFTNDQVVKSVCGSSASIKGLVLKEHPKMVLRDFVYKINKDECQKLHESGIREFLCKLLKEPYFRCCAIDANGNIPVYSQTMYGIHYIKSILNDFALKSYENVSELKYDFFNAKFAAYIHGPDNTDGELSYVDGTVKLVCRKSDLVKHDTIITKLINY